MFFRFSSSCLSPRSRCSLLVLGTFALSACGPSPAPTETEANIAGTSTSAITKGRADDADGSAVWIVAEIGGKTGYCSGVVVSPHVVLTAGHCAKPDARFRIFLGSDYSDATAKARPESYVSVSEHRPHPKYDPTTNLHDIGVLVTAAPIPRAAATINRDPLKPRDRGRPIRIVGFGQTTAKDEKTIGHRHEATTTLADYDATGLAMEGTPSFCLFDSGGPTFMTRGGAEVVVGIHSIIEAASCDKTAWDVRVDVYADFVDAEIAKADPPAAAPEGPSPNDAEPRADAGAAAPEAAPSNPDAGCSIAAPTGTSTGTPFLAPALALAAALIGRRMRRL